MLRISAVVSELNLRQVLLPSSQSLVRLSVGFLRLLVKDNYTPSTPICPAALPQLMLDGLSSTRTERQ